MNKYLNNQGTANYLAKEYNIPLIRIPYTKINELTIKDLLLDNNKMVVL